MVKYKGKPTVNFPGEAPLASVLAALPAAPAAPPPPPAPLPRNARTRTPKVIVDPEALTQTESRRRSKKESKKAWSLPRPLVKRTFVEGAMQKSNGKWTNYDTFPGREFDDLDAYRAAKKQRVARRAAYSAQANAGDKRY